METTTKELTKSIKEAIKPSFINPQENMNKQSMDAIQAVLVADRQALTRSGIATTLKAINHCEVIAETGDFITTLREVERCNPQILLFEPRVLGKNPTDISIELTRIAPAMKQVILLDEQDTCCELIHRMPLAGGLMKIDDLETLREVITEVIAGRPAFSDAYFKAANSRKPCESLTEREREVMAAILNGLTSRDIGAKLGISVKTVENHRTNLMRKLDVHSIATLSQWARANQCIYGA